MGQAYLNEDELKKYLGKGKSYCREECQFAVFLYDIFLKEKMKREYIKYKEENIIRKCLKVDESISIKIEEVYFEVTLMRDYFNENRGEFNKKLLEFCLGYLQSDEVCESRPKEIDDILDWLKVEDKKIKSRNMGEKEAVKIIRGKYFTPDELKEKIKDEKNKEGKIDERKMREAISLDIAKKMMNAALDILVIYRELHDEETEDDGKLKAKALECKYLSDEGSYEDIAGVKCRMQLFIQECIMCFLFGKSNAEKSDIEDHIPKCPDKKNTIWKEDAEKLKLWKDTCRKVYKDILEQEREAKDIINAGVELIRFKGPENKKKDDKGIPIEIDKLIQKEYENIE